MKIIRSGMMVSLLVSAFFISACATSDSGSPASGPTPSRTMPPRTTSSPSSPLQDCIARIPKDATAGQRSIAEKTCARDYVDTKADRQAAASGTEGDTLQACKDRIPRDASTGQRMIAEESCKRDEANRRGIDVVPGLR
jgi:hypothetical protein